MNYLLFPKGKRKTMLEVQKSVNIFVLCKAARIVAVHRFISNKGVRSTGLTKWQPTKNSDYVYLVELLRKYTRKTTLYRATPLDSIYIPKKINIDISKINLPLVVT